MLSGGQNVRLAIAKRDACRPLRLVFDKLELQDEVDHRCRRQLAAIGVFFVTNIGRHRFLILDADVLLLLTSASSYQDSRVRIFGSL